MLNLAGFLLHLIKYKQVKECRILIAAFFFYTGSLKLNKGVFMEKPFILHMLTTAKNLSPFDVNMAMDAGWVSAMSYTNIEASEVQGLSLIHISEPTRRS